MVCLRAFYNELIAFLTYILLDNFLIIFNLICFFVFLENLIDFVIEDVIIEHNPFLDFRRLFPALLCFLLQLDKPLPSRKVLTALAIAIDFSF